jgi:hypothetical protein
LEFKTLFRVRGRKNKRFLCAFEGDDVEPSQEVEVDEDEEDSMTPVEERLATDERVVVHCSDSDQLKEDSVPRRETRTANGLSMVGAHALAGALCTNTSVRALEIEFLNNPNTFATIAQGTAVEK